MIAAVEDVCEEPSVDWKALAGTLSGWADRRHAARTAHLEKLAHHEVMEDMDIPADI